MCLTYCVKNPSHDNCQKSQFWNQDPGQPLKKFPKFFFSRDSWDLLLWSILVAKLTTLTHYRQNDHFVTLGRKIWNQDSDQIFIFFRNFFFYQNKVEPLRCAIIYKRDPDLFIKKNFLAITLFSPIFVKIKISILTPKDNFSGINSMNVCLMLIFAPENPSTPKLTSILPCSVTKINKNYFQK